MSRCGCKKLDLIGGKKKFDVRGIGKGMLVEFSLSSLGFVAIRFGLGGFELMIEFVLVLRSSCISSDSSVICPPAYDKQIHCQPEKMHPFTKPLDTCTKIQSIKN